MNQYFINTREAEKRVAVIQDGKLSQLYLEGEGQQSLVGNLYLGIVEKVVTGMNAAFVNIGRGKTGYLHITQIPAYMNANRELKKSKSIGHFVHQGEKVVVQVTKDETDAKAYRLTGNIELTGKSIVYLPYGDYIAVSKKMPEDSSKRWRQWAQQTKVNNEGFVIRTRADQYSTEEIQGELEELREQFKQIDRRVPSFKAPAILYKKDTFMEVIENLMSTIPAHEIFCDKQDDLVKIKALLEDTSVSAEYYRGVENIFSHFHINGMLEQLQQKTVMLENGANIVIEEAEAFTIIDVNSGNFTKGQVKEAAIMSVNILAAREIVRQIQLRNLSGIILIDFINMKSDRNKEQLLKLLRDLFKIDSNNPIVYGFTSLGIVEVARKRTTVSLKEKQEITCPTCSGKGTVHSPESVAFTLERELWEYRNSDVTEITVEATDDVHAFFTGENANHLKNLEATLHIKIKFLPLHFNRPHYHIKRVLI